MKKKILVIVDMQPRFSASNKKITQAAVLKLVANAIRNRWPIVVLEWANTGGYGDEEQNTHKRIMQALEGYNLAIARIKNSDDGSEEVLETKELHRWKANTFVVCGVNTDACVRATAQGLAAYSKKYKIELPARACNTTTWNVPWNHVLTLPNMKRVA